MKKIYTILTTLLITVSIFAQAPDKMSYQAIVRDGSDVLVSNQSVGIQISILQNSSTGTAVYVERQTAISNAKGLVSLEIGGVNASVIFGTINTIDWSTGSYFIKTETDPTGGFNYTISGTNEIMSVPYAFYAKKVELPIYTVNTFYPELGGYVVEIKDGGKHGLVVAMQDQGTSNYYEADNLFNDSSNHDVNGARFFDWRLPNKRELNLMFDVYLNGNQPGFNDALYWSSSSMSSYSSCYTKNFILGNGQMITQNKNNIHSVRTVRVF